MDRDRCVVVMTMLPNVGGVIQRNLQTRGDDHGDDRLIVIFVMDNGGWRWTSPSSWA